jgi:hypothetical protein
MIQLDDVETLEKEFDSIIQDIEANKTVQQMHEYRQHCSTDCYAHCRHVAFYSYVICKKYGLDYRAAARAGMIHDLFLYDWRKKQDDRVGLHAFTHPKIAFRNAIQLFDLTEKEKDIIVKHMWPLTLVPPKYRESYIISFVDKYCAIQESYESFKSNFKNYKLYRYAHVFVSILLLKLF